MKAEALRCDYCGGNIMEHILSLSYGKDSLACLEACKLLGYPIDRVIHAEVWATCSRRNIEIEPCIELWKGEK